LFLENRYDGSEEACDQFEALDFDEGNCDDESFAASRYLEQIKSQNIDDIIEQLYNPNREVINKAVSIISRYIYLDNPSAYERLLEYYLRLGPATDLEDVHARIKIVELLSFKGTKEEIAKAFVHELARTQSNNTTRQLYAAILEHLSRYQESMVQDVHN